MRSIAYWHFNSNMVWLKGNSKVCSISQIRWFQFQYGLIKSKEETPIIGKIENYFNSNMVWLKVIEVKDVASVGAIFQFQYGLIKRKPQITSMPRWKNFNSNMVWLKALTSNFSLHNLNISIPIWFD